MDVRAETTRFGPTSHPQMSSECDPLRTLLEGLRRTKAKRVVVHERRGRHVNEVVAYLGLDWGDERHAVHLQTADGAVERCELEQKPDVLHTWIAQLQQRFQGAKVAVALEQRKG